MKTKFIMAVFISVLFASSVLAQEQKQDFTATSDPSKISLDIKGMDIVDVAKMLATRSGMNIIVGKNVTGRVTLFLKNVDVWDAFEIILLANDLAYEKRGDIINIMTQRDYELKYGESFQDKKQAKLIQLKYAKAQDLSKALNQIKSKVGKVVVDDTSNTLVLIDAPEKVKEMAEFIESVDLPVETKVFNLNYAKVSDISKSLQETITKGIGTINIDERTNKIIITDYPDKLEQIAKLISAFDEKTSQVLIDAQIIEIKPSDKYEMGVDWEYWIRKHFQVSSSLSIGTTGRLLLGTTTAEPAKRGQYKAIVDMLRTIGDTKILSSPRIMVLNNQEAKILVGTKDAYITSSTSQTGETAVTSQSVNFVDVGIKLYVTPTISRDNFVTLKIKPEVSSATRTQITSQGVVTEVPIVTTSEAETTIMVKDGITIIMGGLRKDQKTKTVKKIPIFSDIPFIGAAFRNRSEELTTTELVILLTPYILSGENALTDFAELKPKDGMIAKMDDKYDIVTEKIARPKEVSEYSEAEYYNLIYNLVQKLAIRNQPRVQKGDVKVKFSLSRNGSLIGEPSILQSTNDYLNGYAAAAVKQASPFPPLPSSLGTQEQQFKITIEYK